MEAPQYPRDCEKGLIYSSHPSRGQTARRCGAQSALPCCPQGTYILIVPATGRSEWTNGFCAKTMAHSECQVLPTCPILKSDHDASEGVPHIRPLMKRGHEQFSNKGNADLIALSAHGIRPYAGLYLANMGLAEIEHAEA